MRVEDDGKGVLVLSWSDQACRLGRRTWKMGRPPSCHGMGLGG